MSNVTSPPPRICKPHNVNEINFLKNNSIKFCRFIYEGFGTMSIQMGKSLPRRGVESLGLHVVNVFLMFRY